MGISNLVDPLRDVSSMTTAPPTTLAPKDSNSSFEHCIDPPVANRSSMITIDLFSRFSYWMLKELVPYSSL